ncbi:hypothetical protein ACFQZ4_51245 [Catellatospora coxensis]
MSRPSDPAEHWQSVYHRTAPHQVSWYQAEPAMSLRLVESAAPAAPSSTSEPAPPPSSTRCSNAATPT